LLELPDDQRTAAILHYFQDATGPEIAQALDVSETSARRILGRAPRQLGSRLGADH